MQIGPATVENFLVIPQINPRIIVWSRIESQLKTGAQANTCMKILIYKGQKVETPKCSSI